MQAVEIKVKRVFGFKFANFEHVKSEYTQKYAYLFEGK